MSIRSKLLLAFSTVLALAAGVAGYGIQAISNADDLVVRLYEQPFMAVSYARSAQVQFAYARVAMERRFSPQGAGQQYNDAVLKSAINDVMEDLAVVERRLIQAEHLKRLTDAKQLTEDWYRAGLQIVAPPADGVAQAPQLANVMSQADVVAVAIDRVVEDASEYGFKFRSQAKAEVAASRSRLIVLAIGTGIVGFALSLAIAYSFGRAIRNAMAISERVAAGNLSEAISTRRRDELGRLLNSLGQMQDALRNQADAQRLVAELKDQDHAKQVARRQRIEQQIADFRNSIGTMLGQVKEVVERMNSTALTLSTISIDADHRAKEATGNAEGTSVDVASVAASTEQLEVSIREITNRLTPATASISRTTEMVGVTNEMISRLAEAAKRIGDIVGLIRSIAEHTNLLALNATIEAARAGSAGRGFAIVASEVKALATETAKATEEISGQVLEVQSSTIQAVQKIESIASVMAEINVATMEIAVSVQQQGAAAQEIARSIYSAASSSQNVARNVLETTAAIGETNSAAAEVLDAATYLTRHTTNLQESVDRFLHDVAAA